jgi:hypothetical protein
MYEQQRQNVMDYLGRILNLLGLQGMIQPLSGLLELIHNSSRNVLII